MSDLYERCTKHNLTRCAVCSRLTQPSANLRTPATVSEMLDGPDAPMPAVWDTPTGKTAIDDAVIAAEPSLRDAIKPMLDKALEPLFNSEPLIKMEPASSNPVVHAAKEYAHAQEKVEAYKTEIHNADRDLERLREVLAEALTDRDIKRATLQKLVTG